MGSICYACANNLEFLFISKIHFRKDMRIMEKKKMKKHVEEILSIMEQEPRNLLNHINVLATVRAKLTLAQPTKKVQSNSSIDRKAFGDVDERFVGTVVEVTEYFHKHGFTFAEAYDVLEIVEDELMCNRYV